MHTTRPERANHHQKAVDQLVRQVEEQGEFDAVILAGSVARGTAADSSDIDCYLLASDTDYRRRKAANRLGQFLECDYPGGYVDGKVITLDILHLAEMRGTEPMRASFVGAQVVYSRIGDLQPLLDSIAVYPESNRERNMRDFYCAMALHASYFGPQALLKQDPFLLAHATSQCVLFAGRAVLAYNRMLFPCAKQLFSTLAQAESLPDRFAERTQELLATPSAEGFGDYLTTMMGFTDWGLEPLSAVSRFMELDEWRWLEGEPELAQR